MKISPIRTARIEKGLTQEQLARKIGVSRQVINSIENNHYNITLKNALKICHELNKTLDDLFFEPNE